MYVLHTIWLSVVVNYSLCCLRVCVCHMKADVIVSFVTDNVLDNKSMRMVKHMLQIATDSDAEADVIVFCS